MVPSQSYLSYIRFRGVTKCPTLACTTPGGKKDATFIAELFEVKVLEYDPQLLCTDVFYLMGHPMYRRLGKF